MDECLFTDRGQAGALPNAVTGFVESDGTLFAAGDSSWFLRRIKVMLQKAAAGSESAIAVKLANSSSMSFTSLLLRTRS